MPQGWSKWIAVLASGVLVALPLGSSPATGAISVPSLTVPGTEPGVTLPGVTTPTVPLPGAEVPSTQLPSVQVPRTQLPSTTTPSVSLPSKKTASSTPTSTKLPSQPTGGTNQPYYSGPSGTLPGSGSTPGSSGGTSGSGGSNSGGSSSGSISSSGGGHHGRPGAVRGTGPGRGRGAFSDTNARLASTAEQLRSTLAPLHGCFYGLTGIERSVLNLRAGFGGKTPHTRQQVANRLNTSTGKVRQTEQRAMQRLRGLAQSDGCSAAAGSSGVTIVNNVIGPAEIAASPALIAFGNPAYQGARVSAFSRRGPIVDVGSPAPLPASFGESATSGSTWAAQLLAVMLLVALGGFVRVFPLTAAQRRRARIRVVPSSLEQLRQMPLEGEANDLERDQQKIAA